MAMTTHSGALNSSAMMTMASITQRTKTAATTRTPRSPYGIQTSACVHMTSETARAAGQTYGMRSSDGQIESHRVRIHRPAIDAAPYSIGQPTSAALETGSVNIRAGYMD